FDDLTLLSHLLLAAKDAEVLVHRSGQLVADRPRPLSLAAVEQLPQLALGVGLDRRRHLHRGVRKRPVGSVATDALPEGDRLHQRIAAEAIGAVNGPASALACGVKTL